MILARTLANYLREQYHEGRDHGQRNVPPDPGRITSDPGVEWRYSDVRWFAYMKGWTDGKAEFDASYTYIARRGVQ